MKIKFYDKLNNIFKEKMFIALKKKFSKIQQLILFQKCQNNLKKNSNLFLKKIQQSNANFINNERF